MEIMCQKAAPRNFTKWDHCLLLKLVLFVMSLSLRVTSIGHWLESITHELQEEGFHLSGWCTPGSIRVRNSLCSILSHSWTRQNSESWNRPYLKTKSWIYIQLRTKCDSNHNFNQLRGFFRISFVCRQDKFPKWVRPENGYAIPAHSVRIKVHSI